MSVNSPASTTLQAMDANGNVIAGAIIENDFNATATGSTSATATVAANASGWHLITDITVSSDKAGSTAQIKSASTTIWDVQVGTGERTINFGKFLKIAKNTACSVTIDGTSLCKANINGFTMV